MANWLEGWFDTLSTLMAVSDNSNRTVTTFSMFSRNDFPAAIAPEMVPCAVSYISGCQAEYSAGGPSILFWKGQTEFHLTVSVGPQNIPYVMEFFEKIVRAAAGNATLSGAVEIFLLDDSEQAMTFATYQNAEGKDDHQGILVRWTVKQPVSGDLTVA